MFEQILNGVPPSHVFRGLAGVDASLTNIKLSQLLRQEFPNLDGLAVQLVWGWRGPGKKQGLSDESLDIELLRLLKEAGY